jgi:hypothetical protein
MLGTFIIFILLGCLLMTGAFKILELFFKLIYRILLIGKTIDTAIGRHHNAPTTNINQGTRMLCKTIRYILRFLGITKDETLNEITLYQPLLLKKNKHIHQLRENKKK